MNKNQRHNILNAIIRDMQTSNRTDEQIAEDLERVFTPEEIDQLYTDWEEYLARLGLGMDGNRLDES